ncbi:hypothetical protein [Deinococcus planocerae]|uniref:hypothetical protein n=1 Tax=Deinococcus planocerae TaxID=1737569 RepID=UPI0011AF6D42|nr:hypothetical protein [Deinococcus planocerae]
MRQLPELRQQFIQANNLLGAETLSERPLVGAGGDTYFTVSTAAVHIDLFDQIGHIGCRSFAGVQRTFSMDKYQGAGKYPLANPLELMASTFLFNERYAADCLAPTLRTALDVFRMDIRDIWFRVSGRNGIPSVLQLAGVAQDHVVISDRLKPLSLGSSRPGGEYIFLYARYRHGLVSLGAFGLIEYEQRFSMDSALFLDRVQFINEAASSPFESTLFLNTMPAVRLVLGASFKDEQLRLWAVSIRCLVALIGDGGQIGHRGSGHVIKNMVRSIAYTLAGAALPPHQVEHLTRAAVQDLLLLGMDLTTHTGRICEQLSEWIATYSIRIRRELQQSMHRILLPHLSPEEEQTLLSERGLRIDWIRGLREQAGLPVHHADHSSSLRNAAYPFEAEPPVPVDILR